MVTRAPVVKHDDGFYPRARLVEMRDSFTIGRLSQYINFRKPWHIGLQIEEGVVTLVVADERLVSVPSAIDSASASGLADLGGSVVRPVWKPSAEFDKTKLKMNASAGNLRAYLVEAGFHLEDVSALGRVELVALSRWARDNAVEFASLANLSDGEDHEGGDDELEDEPKDVQE